MRAAAATGTRASLTASVAASLRSRAASAAASEISYVRALLTEMGLDMTAPTVLYVDNQGAVELSRDRKSCHRSRHVDRRFFKVRELVAEGEIDAAAPESRRAAARSIPRALPRLRSVCDVFSAAGGREILTALSRQSVSRRPSCACSRSRAVAAKKNAVSSPFRNVQEKLYTPRCSHSRGGAQTRAHDARHRYHKYFPDYDDLSCVEERRYRPRATRKRLLEPSPRDYLHAHSQI